MTGSCVDPGDRRCHPEETPESGTAMVRQNGSYGGDGTHNAGYGDSNGGPSSNKVIVPQPPDGGWGWVVVFASFMIHVIADGVTYTFGIFYNEFLKYYGEGKGKTAWIASIMAGTTYCIGPMASGLTNKYGCRAVTVGGAVLAACGLILSTFSPDVVCLFFTIGLCSGAGFGLMYLPSIVSVTSYFEKKRAFATGMAVCGSGMGTFALAPLTQCLVEYYGWKGAMLIIAGLVLNCAVFGALFRPLEISPETSEQQTASNVSSKKKKNVKNADGSLAPLVHKQPSSANRKSTSATTNGTVPRKDLSQRASIQTVDLVKDNSAVVFSFTTDLDPEFSVAEPNGYLANGKNRVNGCLLPKSRTDEISPLRSTLTIPSDFLRRKVEGTSLSSFVCSSASLAQTNKELLQLETYSQPLSGGILYRQDIFHSGSMQNLSKYRSHPNISYTTVNNCNNNSSNNKKQICGCCPQEVREAFMEVTHFSLLKDPIFLMFGISNFLTSIGFNVPYVYTKDRVEELGIATSEDASFLLAIIGISNTVGRVTLGYLSDRSCVNRLWVYNTSLVVSGLATALSCYAANYTMMAMYCATFGVTTGAYVSLTSVILVDLLGLDKLTNAFGLLLVFQGVSCLLGPPITGWLYDGLGSYDPGFYVSGAMIAASGFMLFFVPCVQKLTERKRAANGTSLMNNVSDV